jgi:hypothetical protein
MATREEVIQAIRNADASGDSASVRKLGAYLKTLPAAEAAPNPTDSMSTGERFLAGAGKAFTDVGRGIKQLIDVPAVALENTFGGAKLSKKLGMPTAKESATQTQASIDEAKVIDAPLMETTAGKVGNVTGHVAAALPTVFIPGAATVKGAAAIGAGLGFVQPVASDESRLENTAIGGVAGVGGVMLGRAAVAGVKGAKALVEPFTQRGRQAIAGRTLERFGVQAGDIAGTTATPTVTGARPTLAEQITRPEGAAAAARLQDSVRALDPEIAAKFTAREIENNTARVGTLRELAGDDGAREFAKAMRDGTAKELYGKAFGVKMDFSQLSKAERGEITKLMKMPAVQGAMKSAREIAANQGLKLGKPDGSVEGLHLMKLAMDDAINNAGTSAAQVNKAMSIKMARDRLVTFLERMSPDYGEARATYAAMSKPLNQMDVAETLFRKGTSATSDLGGTPRLLPDRYVNLLKNEEATVKAATGREMGKLSQLLDPEQLQKVMAVGQELDRAAAVGRAGNGPGSATAQRLSSQNILRQLLGPTGLPESWAESTLLNTAMRPVQFAYSGVAEPRIQQVLAELMLDPTKAQAALQAARIAPHTLSPEMRAALPYLEHAMRTALPAAAVSR